MKDVDETEDEDADHVEGEGDEEHEEVPVVPPPDAVVDPGNDSCDSLYDSLVTAYQGQWWSNISMQLLHTLQWLHLGGR